MKTSVQTTVISLGIRWPQRPYFIGASTCSAKQCAEISTSTWDLNDGSGLTATESRSFGRGRHRADEQVRLKADGTQVVIWTSRIVYGIRRSFAEVSLASSLAIPG